MVLIEVARLSDVPDGSLKNVEINSKEILLANVGGTIYAMDDPLWPYECVTCDGRA